MLRIRSTAIAVFAVILVICGSGFAEEDKTKGLDVVTDTTVAVIKKANAFLQGNLEWTMPAGTSNYKKDYTIDATGRRVPSKTLGKYDSGVR